MSIILKRAKVSYLECKGKKKLKIRQIGDVREGTMWEIESSWYFLPQLFKEMIQSNVKSVNIIKKSSHGRNGSRYTVGTFNPKNKVIELFDKECFDESDCSSDFLHECGHAMFDIIMNNYGYNESMKNPLWIFVNEICKNKIKPISDYTKTHLDKTDLGGNDGKDIHYVNELFAEFFAHNYCRTSDERYVKGSFINFVKLKNYFWDLMDGLLTYDPDEDDPEDEDCDCSECKKLRRLEGEIIG